MVEIGDATGVSMTWARFPTAASVIIWILRVSTMALAATVPLLDIALDSLSDARRLATSIALWVVWSAVLLCVLVPSSASLTGLRLMMPTHLGVTIAVSIGAADAGWRTLLALAIGIVATATAMSAEVGRHWVQLSAYGDERRFPLACPPITMAVQILTWTMWFALAVVAVSVPTTERPSTIGWIVASIAALLAIGGAVVLPRRFHRLTRRWLVWVPAGVVIHDHVVLAETAMMSKRSISSVELWQPGSEALNASGAPSRRGLEISLHDPETMIMAPTKEHPGGHALHVRSFMVRPTRVQPALAELSERLAGPREH